MRKISLCFCLFFTGCASNHLVTPMLGSNDDLQCRSPVGNYENIGQIEGDLENPAPLLSTLVFDGELAGFSVSHLIFETDSEGRLNIHAWVGDTQLEETRTLKPRNDKCTDGRWRITSSWDAMIMEGAVAGLLWTGGIFIPAAQREEYEFAFADTGDLLVHHIGRTAGAYFFFFPMYSRGDEFWLRYPKRGNNPASQTNADQSE